MDLKSVYCFIAPSSAPSAAGQKLTVLSRSTWKPPSCAQLPRARDYIIIDDHLDRAYAVHLTRTRKLNHQRSAGVVK